MVKCECSTAKPVSALIMAGLFFAAGQEIQKVLWERLNRMHIGLPIPTKADMVASITGQYLPKAHVMDKKWKNEMRCFQ